MLRSMTYTTVLPLALLLVAGCGQPQAEKTGLPDSPPETGDSEHAGHPTEGPHHGDLIELGNEEYHAELLHPEHGEKSAVTIYILDGATAKKQVPIDADNVTINLSHEGQPEQFKLNANPAEGDPPGQSSRFTSSDAELLAHFGEEEIEGRLMLKINGKSYSGQIRHRHDHAGHAHSH